MKRALLIALACGCSSGGGTGGGDLAGGGGDMAMTMMGGIPAAGSSHDVDNDFKAVEPNDTPQTATPLGATTLNDIHVWVNGNTIGGADTADYFVFESGAMAGQFTFDICWSAGPSSMTATLWKVSGGQAVNPPIHTWASSGMCVMSAAMGDAPLAPNTEYLFGVMATGASGTYSA